MCTDKLKQNKMSLYLHTCTDLAKSQNKYAVLVYYCLVLGPLKFWIPAWLGSADFVWTSLLFTMFDKEDATSPFSLIIIMKTNYQVLHLRATQNRNDFKIHNMI